MEHSLKVLAQIDEDNKNYDFLIKYLKFRMFTKQIIEKRQIEKRYQEGDLSSLLFVYDDSSKAKPLNFASMIFGKSLSKNPEITKDCELKGNLYHLFVKYMNFLINF